MPTAWPATILFDFDGVIVNSEPLHCRAFQRVAAQHDIKLSSEDYYAELIGFDDRGAWRHLFAEQRRPLTPELFAQLLDEKSATVREMMARGEFDALPGAAELIRAAARTRPLAICSGALRHEIETMLRGIGLHDCFSAIIAAEDVAIGKPDPSGYLLALRLVSSKLGRALRPAEALVIEDAPIVISAVRHAGFRTLGVATSHTAEALRGADWVALSLQLPALRKLIPELDDSIFSGVHC